MKYTTFSALALAALTFSIQANDDDIPQQNIWEGFYVGVNAGYGVGATTGAELNHSSSLDPAFNNGNGNIPAKFAVNSDGGFGGGQLGYNWLVDRFLVGLETDIQGSAIGDTKNLSTSLGSLFCDSSSMGQHNLNYFGTARIRFGVTPLENLLVYVTGGYAYGRTHAEADTAWNSNGYACGGPLNGAKNETLSGWSTGLGGEYSLSDEWSIKVEYLHLGLGNSQVTGITPYGYSAGDINYKFNNSFDIFRLGANFHF